MAHDEAMLAAYKAKKDLYATIAQSVYHNEYWDNMEHHEDGSPNPEGKKRRSACKGILLGIMYGRGVASIAEQTGCTTQEAQKIIDNFYKSFPAVKAWTDKTQEDAKKYGYVEDYMGRRRRLPDIQKAPVEVKYIDENRPILESNFNPLIGSTGKYVVGEKTELDDFRDRALACKGWRQMATLKEEAKERGIVITENSGFIAQAERQCVNARIQGGAASVTKLAMSRVYNDGELNALGFKLLICVHDELIGECPEENAEACGKRLAWVMIDSVKDTVECPMKCDDTVTRRWYEDEVAAKLQEQQKKLLAEGKTESEIRQIIFEDHEELNDNDLDILLSMEL